MVMVNKISLLFLASLSIFKFIVQILKNKNLKNEKPSGSKLERNILELHKINEQTKALTEKLNASIAEDDAARDRLS